jgi:hypothetical protein
MVLTIFCQTHPPRILDPPAPLKVDPWPCMIILLLKSIRFHKRMTSFQPPNTCTVTHFGDGSDKTLKYNFETDQTPMKMSTNWLTYSHQVKSIFHEPKIRVIFPNLLKTKVDCSGERLTCVRFS